MCSGIVLDDSSKTDSEFLIYSTTRCPYCVGAKRYLTSKGISFVEIMLDNNYQKRNDLIMETGHRTVPIIFDLRSGNPIFIGGFDDLLASGVA